MDRNFRVSVALCTYNGAPFIAAQLESILKQTRPPDEVIVSDDGSEDESLAIVKRFEAGFPSVVRLAQTPQRLGYAKNFEHAIGEASHDIIFLSDQDDVWFETKIESMLRPFAANDRVDLVYGDAQLTDAALRPLGRTIFQAAGSMHLDTRHAARDLVRGADLAVQGATIALRSRLRASVLPVDDVTWGHDHWIVFIAHAISEVQAVDEPLMYYRRHERNSAYNRTFDGQWWREWSAGVRTPGAERYEREVRRWDAMLQRLEALRAGAVAVSPDVLDEFIRESRRRLEFARCRAEIQRTARHRRIAPTVRLLLRGEYHSYVHGFKSFGKDLLM